MAQEDRKTVLLKLLETDCDPLGNISCRPWQDYPRQGMNFFRVGNLPQCLIVSNLWFTSISIPYNFE